MKNVILIVLLALNAIFSFAQKPPLDAAAWEQWPSVNDPKISNNGRYAAYCVNVITANMVRSRILVLQATDGSWIKEMPGVASYNCQFTNDSRFAVLINAGDSLVIITLGGVVEEYIPGVSTFRLPARDTAGWLAYRLKTPGQELVLCNMRTNRKRLFTGVTNYLFNDQGSILLLQTKHRFENSIALLCLTLSSEEMTTIWRGKKAWSHVFNSTGTALAYITGNETGTNATDTIWYYQNGTGKAAILLHGSAGIDSSWRIADIVGFCKDESGVFFKVAKTIPQLLRRADAVNMDIWSYQDEKLQSLQLREGVPLPGYTAFVNISGHQVVRLGKENELVLLPGDDGRADDIVFIQQQQAGELTEWYWNPASRLSFYVAAVNKGIAMHQQVKEMEFGGSASLSPAGRYVIWYAPEQKSYFTRSVASGTRLNITKDIPVTWTTYGNDHADSSYAVNAVAGWMQGDAAVLLQDQYDIWQVDPGGNALPVNLTNGYGRRHNIVFRLAFNYAGSVIDPGEELLLAAFDRTSKYNGFYSIIPGQGGDPRKLTMGPYVYEVPDCNPTVPGLPGEPPIKARDAAAYLVRRMSATTSPNYFFTTDFKSFSPLTNVYPEKDYNWLTTELITWKMPGGKYCQGVLYKPEDFDPARKYPLILYYYEKLSDLLHVYLPPDAAHGSINIPWLVSNGYLVFTPDIHYQPGATGQSACDAVVAAAKHLSRQSFVDAARIGIQGHSLGGYETNYIVTHTDIFAAAATASGLSDCISDFGSLWGPGMSKQGFYTTLWGEDAAPWKKPGLFTGNSPVFRADKVVTPLLMMHNKGDGNVPFAQSLGFFAALHRLGKKVWMLQYNGEGHTVTGNEAAKDYTMRLAGFFDHYLKGKPAPAWMTTGK